MLNSNLKTNILIIFLSILFSVLYIFFIIQYDTYLYPLPFMTGLFIGERFINPLIFKNERRQK